MLHSSLYAINCYMQTRNFSLIFLPSVKDYRRCCCCCWRILFTFLLWIFHAKFKQFNFSFAPLRREQRSLMKNHKKISLFCVKKHKNFYHRYFHIQWLNKCEWWRRKRRKKSTASNWIFRHLFSAVERVENFSLKRGESRKEWDEAKLYFMPPIIFHT